MRWTDIQDTEALTPRQGMAPAVTCLTTAAYTLLVSWLSGAGCAAMSRYSGAGPGDRAPPLSVLCPPLGGLLVPPVWRSARSARVGQGPSDPGKCVGFPLHGGLGLVRKEIDPYGRLIFEYGSAGQADRESFVVCYQKRVRQKTTSLISSGRLSPSTGATAQASVRIKVLGDHMFVSSMVNDV